MGCASSKGEEINEPLHVASTPETNRAASVIQTVLVRGIDPITMQPIRRPLLLHRNGVMIRMQPESLFQYVAKTGDMCDPVCKQRYATHELLRLQRMAGKILPANIEGRFADEMHRGMMIDFFVDEIAAAQANDDEDPVVFDAVANIRQLVHSSHERDLVLARLRRLEVDQAVLAPLLLMATEDSP
jgi:hypothetical protein